MLREAGCEFVRQGKGSHEIWFSPLTRRHFPLPYDIQKTATANAILRQAGLPKAF
jgi:predicted RNA binding protein YcfA (HicA-like mRNA interferase family)